MKEYYVLNTSGYNGLEVYEIGEEKKLLDKIVSINGAFEGVDKVTVSKFIDGDRSVFFKHGLRSWRINSMDVYLAKNS